MRSQLQSSAQGRASHTFTVACILDYAYLFRDDELLHHGETAAALAPPLQFRFLDRAIGRQDVIVQFHVAAVEHDGCLPMLPGQTTSRKTMPTARLVAAGGADLSDEAGLLERARTDVRPVPISFCVKSMGVPLLVPHFAGLAERAEHDREDGYRGRYMPPPACLLTPASPARR
ncbi:MAG: hypothetical protein AB7O80_27585 [Acetobacteraceae bacterium]